MRSDAGKAASAREFTAKKTESGARANTHPHNDPPDAAPPRHPVPDSFLAPRASHRVSNDGDGKGGFEHSKLGTEGQKPSTRGP